MAGQSVPDLSLSQQWRSIFRPRPFYLRFIRLRAKQFELGFAKNIYRPSPWWFNYHARKLCLGSSHGPEKTSDIQSNAGRVSVALRMGWPMITRRTTPCRIIIINRWAWANKQSKAKLLHHKCFNGHSLIWVLWQMQFSTMSKGNTTCIRWPKTHTGPVTQALVL